MITRRGAVLVKAIVGVLALGAVGAAAHHLSGGRCLFSSCHVDKTGSTVATVSHTASGVWDGRCATTEASYFEVEEAACPNSACPMSTCEDSGAAPTCPLEDGKLIEGNEQTASRQGK